MSIMGRLCPLVTLSDSAIRAGAGYRPASCAYTVPFARVARSESIRKGASMSEERTPSAREQLMAYALKERAAVRKLQHAGECDGSRRPTCYEQCEHGFWCSELRHTIRLPF